MLAFVNVEQLRQFTSKRTEGYHNGVSWKFVSRKIHPTSKYSVNHFELTHGNGMVRQSKIYSRHSDFERMAHFAVRCDLRRLAKLKQGS